jgi:hypothetical protein
MLSSSEILIDRLIEEIEGAYRRNYGLLKPEYPNIAGWAARMALENIRNSDALYHNIEHTALVTEVGLHILSGRQIRDGGVSPEDWLMYTVALVCHDIGYVRGVCHGDQPGIYMTGKGDETVTLAAGATDASLTSYHIDRGKLFIKERFEGHPILDADQICRNIEYTRFPVPTGGDYDSTSDYPALLRAADLIGQLADPRYLMKLPALFYEFFETGANIKLGYETPDDLRREYPGFFWNVVHPYVTEAIDYLRITAHGYQWVANLHSVVFDVESRSKER